MFLTKNPLLKAPRSGQRNWKNLHTRTYIHVHDSNCYSVLQLKAQSFLSIDGHPKSPITYGLYSDAGLTTPSQYFRIDEQTGVINIRKQIDYEDLATPKDFQLFGISNYMHLKPTELRGCERRRKALRRECRDSNWKLKRQSCSLHTARKFALFYGGAWHVISSEMSTTFKFVQP